MVLARYTYTRKQSCHLPDEEEATDWADSVVYAKLRSQMCLDPYIGHYYSQACPTDDDSLSKLKKLLMECFDPLHICLKILNK